MTKKFFSLKFVTENTFCCSVINSYHSFSISVIYCQNFETYLSWKMSNHFRSYTYYIVIYCQNFVTYLSWKMSNHSHSYTYCIIHVLYFTNYGLDTIIPYLWRHDDVIGREWELLPRVVENSSIMGQSSTIWNMKIRSPKS